MTFYEKRITQKNRRTDRFESDLRPRSLVITEEVVEATLVQGRRQEKIEKSGQNIFKRSQSVN